MGKSVTIYHNPKCTTSCNVLAMIEASGTKPKVVEYLKAGWTKPQLKAPFAAAGLYEFPGPEKADHPWIVGVGFELAGLKDDQIRLQVNHEPIPALRLGENELVGFVRVGGGRHFVEITQPPADPQHRTRRFWYTRAMRL